MLMMMMTIYATVAMIRLMVWMLMLKTIVRWWLMMIATRYLGRNEKAEG
jgi:hypothetical protein